jgi:type II secretory pathway component PulC
VKEKIEKVKKFCHEHREEILISVGATVGAVVSSYVVTKTMQSKLSINYVEVNKESHDVRITYKNGDIEYYNQKTPN